MNNLRPPLDTPEVLDENGQHIDPLPEPEFEKPDYDRIQDLSKVPKTKKSYGKDMHRFCKTSLRKLAQLSFDPLEEMVDQYRSIERARRRLLFNMETGSRKEKYNGVEHAALLASQVSILNTLVRYGYARVPESVEISSIPVRPVMIQLTDELITDLATDALNTVTEEQIREHTGPMVSVAPEKKS